MYVEDISRPPTTMSARDGVGKETVSVMVRYSALFKSNNPIKTRLLYETANSFIAAFKYENRYAFGVPSEAVLLTEFCAMTFFRNQEDEVLSVVYIDRAMVKDDTVVDRLLGGLYKEIENTLKT